MYWCLPVSRCLNRLSRGEISAVICRIRFAILILPCEWRMFIRWSFHAAVCGIQRASFIASDVNPDQFSRGGGAVEWTAGIPVLFYIRTSDSDYCGDTNYPRFEVNRCIHTGYGAIRVRDLIHHSEDTSHVVLPVIWMKQELWTGCL